MNLEKRRYKLILKNKDGQIIDDYIVTRAIEGYIKKAFSPDSDWKLINYELVN